MKAVAYSVKPFEKEFLAKANQKKHDITLISNALSFETAVYADGKDAVIVFTNDDVSAPVINRLAHLGIKYIVTRSVGTDHIDKECAAAHGIKIANVPSYSPEAIAEHTVALALALNRRLVKADEHSHHFDFRNDMLMGFNLHQKTVGLIGLGHIGQATARIFNGFGCKVLGYDMAANVGLPYVEQVMLDELLEKSDIISLHVPLTPDTRYIISKATLAKMKNGVMLLNTSRGGLVNTVDVLDAIDNGKVAYLGMDVYEHEKGLFFEDHEHDVRKDPLLTRLMTHPNVMVTPHQAYLTREAMQEIANQTIKSLNLWSQKQCAGDACTCALNCRVSINPLIKVVTNL